MVKITAKESDFKTTFADFTILNNSNNDLNIGDFDRNY